MANLTPVNSFDNVIQLETNTIAIGGAGGIMNAQAQALLNRTAYLNSALANKLDASAYVQHYLGKFVSLVALQTAIASGTDGDYAIVDSGGGNDALYYIWDAQDGWVSGGTTTASTTDTVTEGSTNLYFTTARVRSTVLTGLSTATNEAITVSDSVLSAFGKLQKQISDLLVTAKTEYIVLAASDETMALTAGTGKITFRMPYAMTLSSVRASLTTAQTSGSIFTVDINENGTSILSTKLTIDNTEKTSTTAATAPVISDTTLADDAEITIDIDQVGDGTAKGLKIMLIGTRT